MDEYVFAFDTTQAAIQAEQQLLKAQIAVRVMSLPAAIGAGCGICLRVDVPALAQARAALENAGTPHRVYHMANGEYRLVPKAEGLLAAQLGIEEPAVVALVGSGGKTALMWQLAQQNKGRPVLVTTTTKIRIPEKNSDYQMLIDRDITQSDVQPSVTLAGTSAPDGKLGALPAEQLAWAAKHYALVLAEADGAAGKPLKGWAEYEPVVPQSTTVTIGVIALWPAGHQVDGALIHRLPLFESMSEVRAGQRLMETHIARAVSHPEGLFAKAAGRRVLFINQVETASGFKQAQAFVSLLPKPFLASLHSVVAGSAQQGRGELLWTQQSNGLP